MVSRVALLRKRFGGSHWSAALRRIRRSASSFRSLCRQVTGSTAGGIGVCGVLAVVALVAVWYVRLAYVSNAAAVNEMVVDVADMQRALNDSRFYRSGVQQVSQPHISSLDHPSPCLGVASRLSN